jgi:hypothetical protein
VEHAGQVHPQLVLPRRGVHGRDRRDVVHDAGVVHQHVHRTEIVPALLGGRRDRASISDVDRQLERSPTDSGDRSGRRDLLVGARHPGPEPVVPLALEPLRVDVGHGDIGAGIGQRKGDRPTDAAGGTGDEGDPTGQRQRVHGVETLAPAAATSSQRSQRRGAPRGR